MKAKKKLTKSLLTDRLDRLAREICKIENDYTCQRCGSSEAGVQWAHIEKRRKKAIRWAQQNALCLCSECHRWFDGQVTAGRVWLAERFPERVAYLTETVGEKPRSALLFTDTIQDMLEMQQTLKDRLKELKGDK